MDNQENKFIDNSERKEKFFTKDKVCFFIVGLLLGAIIASVASLIYINLNSSNNASMGPGNPPSMTDGGTPPEMPEGEMPEGETPPEMPSDDRQESGDGSSTDSDSGNSDTSSSGNSKARPARPNNKSTSTDTNAS